MFKGPITEESLLSSMILKCIHVILIGRETSFISDLTSSRKVVQHLAEIALAEVTRLRISDDNSRSSSKRSLCGEPPEAKKTEDPTFSRNIKHHEQHYRTLFIHCVNMATTELKPNFKDPKFFPGPEHATDHGANPATGIIPRAEQKDMSIREAKIFEILIFVFETFFIVIFGIWFTYAQVPEGQIEVHREYGYFRDISIMVFFGFGFLMTFVRRYAYSAIGYTFLIGAFVTQWSVILQAFVETIATNNSFTNQVDLDITYLTNGLFASAAVLISLGALLGKITPLQVLILAIIEPIFYWLNIYIIIEKLEVIDIGGGMTIHLFGATLGLVVTIFVSNDATVDHKDNTAAYNNDIFSLAGSLFLFIMWPSFNAALAPRGLGELRAQMNTFLSITSSVISAIAVSRLANRTRWKFDAMHVQNSTLAGGVAMGVAAHLYITPGGAMACGFVVGIISVLGYVYLTPWLANHRIQDVAGIVNLHGIPGFISAFISIFIAIGAHNNQGKYLGEYEAYYPRGGAQAAYQVAGTFITIGVALVGGLLIGLGMKLAILINKISTENYFNDNPFWHVPTDYKILDSYEEFTHYREPGQIELPRPKPIPNPL
ncbi:hypothetical protein PROFUN_06698 [Planoprotostelium fungivorum]|uniref:Ammonium transporter AmtB-like domain-containing protein n=1 Tax=Planoprotostelium fungivorum TaxID=1890364 RepID=A0A2P6NG60_9EUKA|nr:hypothetical protein PROFUN_06698 [Planoprotostelium fungivorum]